MNDQKRQKLLDVYTREAEDIDARVAWSVEGHAFVYGDGFSRYAECIGCGARVEDLSPTGVTQGRVVAEKASRDLPPCTKPWNLEERLKEIAHQYSHQGQSVGKGDKVTLESVNAKLEQIITHLQSHTFHQHFRIK